MSHTRIISKEIMFKTKTANAFMRFRADKKDPDQKVEMKQLSKEAGDVWSKLSDPEKRKYYHLAKEDEVKNEAVLGKNKYTNKTFELGDKFSFIVETPIPIKKENQPLVMNNPQNVSNLTEEDWFDKYIDYNGYRVSNEIINGVPPPKTTSNSFGR
ncbi:hypothetical protein C1646_664105 [Rhizophagus diaphanus]|nr:hypothetical protein C1646_664105 [Rhizophagus diaphanus] [Rhizophagus sp. MUCL 43196]